MSDKEITLVLNKRETVRKGLSKLKQAGQIPAVIHNPGKESIIVSGDYTEMTKIYRQAGKHHPIDIKIGNDNYLTIIKDVDFENRKHTIRHIVFGIVRQDKKVETEVPIVIIGDAPAQKTGYMLLRQLDYLEIEAFPRDLPDQMTVSSDKLIEIGDKVTVADIDPIVGVTILTEPEHPIVTVEESRAQAAEEAEAEEAAAAAEAESADTEKSEENITESTESKE